MRSENNEKKNFSHLHRTTSKNREAIIFKRKDLIILLVLLLTAGTLSVLRGQEWSWDLLNYHLYAPYALLEGRIGVDIAPAGRASYVNPLLDFPYYFMFLYMNNHPALVTFLQGLYFGLFAFVLYKICTLVFKPTNPYRGFMIISSLLVSLGGAGAFGQIGTTHNDIQVATLTLAALYVLLKACSCSKNQTKMMILSGLLVGMAAGLKLTAAVYVVTLFLTVLIICKKFASPLKAVGGFCLFGGLGFLLTGGWWMYVLYKHFQNPFFPFYNKIFKSPYYPLENWHDMRYLPRRPIDKLFYPFTWVSNAQISEVYYHDHRFQLLYLVFVTYIIKNFFAQSRNFFKRAKEKLESSIDFEKYKIICLFVFISYVVWQMQFSVIRYALATEVLIGPILIVFVATVLPPLGDCILSFYRSLSAVFPQELAQKNSTRKSNVVKFLTNAIKNCKPESDVRPHTGILLLITFLVLTTDTCDWWKKPFGERLFDTGVKFEKDVLVVLEQQPYAYLLPTIAKGHDAVLTKGETDVTAPKTADIIENLMNTRKKVYISEVKRKGLKCELQDNSPRKVKLYFCFE